MDELLKDSDKDMIAFVIETREGKFAEVPSYTLDFVRIEETSEQIYDELYIYSNSYVS